MQTINPNPNLKKGNVYKKRTKEPITDFSVVEWMHDDALDAKVDFFAASCWEFPAGEGKPGKLRQECSHRRMFEFLPDLG